MDDELNRMLRRVNEARAEESSKGPRPSPMQCHRHLALGLTSPCQVCNNFGLMWSDGAPFTLCPGNSGFTVPHHACAKPLVCCDRALAACPGCYRFRLDIGAANDASRTWTAIQQAMAVSLQAAAGTPIGGGVLRIYAGTVPGPAFGPAFKTTMIPAIPSGPKGK